MTEVTKFKTIAFDLDGTLAASKSAITPTMSSLLCWLLQHYNVAVVSGGSFTQFQKQLVANLKCPTEDAMRKLFLFPTNGSALYVFENHEWRQVYQEPLTPDEKYRIEAAWKVALEQSGVVLPTPSYGAVMEDRDTQITFSACGQEAPISVKETWDPNQIKRMAIRKILAPLLPGLAVSFGGMTSVDVTREGIDKAYAMQKIMDYLYETKDDIMFVGDRLELGGNDYAARRSGVVCVPVANPNETEALIKKLIEETK
jgi:hypothetical protein